MKILHLATWWTISWCVPEYHEIENIAEIFLDYIDIWKYIVYSMKANCEYEFVKICHKDSREILNIDRQRIVDEIEKWYKNWVKLFLITHWTYTMPETWKYIEERLDKETLKNISVVITWSMYPWNIFWSDAPMNIWASISSLLNAENAIWVKICMHWKNWNVNNIEKDVDKLIFQEITK